MVTASEIGDRHQLKKWLKPRPREDGIAIAHRAALRVLPLWGARMHDAWAREGDLTSLPLLRCQLVSGTTALAPTAATKAIASEAANRANASVLTSNAVAYASAAAYVAYANADCASLITLDTTDVANAVANVIDAAAYATGFVDAFWGQIPQDARLLDAGHQPLYSPLWSGDDPDELQHAEAGMLRIWASDPPDRWAFWQRWWAGAKSGRPIDPQLQLAIVQGIDNATWQDPDATAARIREIEAAFYDKPQDTDNLLEAMPQGAPAQIGQTRRAMVQHRRELPPTFDAVLGFIALEVERLRGRNARSQDEADEIARQILSLATIGQAVAELQALVPATGTMTGAEAEQAEKLGRLYLRTFREWAHNSAAELVDSTARFGLVGASTTALTAIGLPASLVMPCALAMFASKDMIAKLKSAKDLLPNGSDKGGSA